MKASLGVAEGAPCCILVARSQALRKALFVYTRFLFSCSCHVTCQRQKLQRSKETLMGTSYSPSMKKGSGRSVNMIKKTGNLLARRNIVASFTRALMCAEPSSPHVYLWCSPLLRCVCLSEKLYIFNWLGLLYGGKGLFPCARVWFYLETAGGLHRLKTAISGLPDCDKTDRYESGKESTEKDEINAWAHASKRVDDPRRGFTPAWAILQNTSAPYAWMRSITAGEFCWASVRWKF